MQTVALTTGKHVHLLLLVGTVEVEARAVGTGVDFAAAQLDGVVAFADDVVHALARFQGLAALVHIGELHGIAHLHGAGIGLFLPHQHLEERGLARAVGADDAHDGTGRDDGVDIFHQHTVAHALADAGELDDALAQTRSRRNVDFQIRGALLALVGKHGLVGVDAGLALGVAALGRHADPLQFAGQGLLAVGFGLFLIGQALLLLFQPGGVVALPRDAPAAVQFQDPAGHVVQEVAVVGHGDDRTGEGGEVTLQPGIQMVGGFVQQQDVRGLQQQAAQGHAAAFATGDLVHGHVGRRAAQGVHGHFQTGVQIPHALVVHQFLHLGLTLDEGVHLLRFHGFGETGIDFLELLGDGHEFAHTAPLRPKTPILAP